MPMIIDAHCPPWEEIRQLSKKHFLKGNCVVSQDSSLKFLFFMNSFSKRGGFFSSDIEMGTKFALPSKVTCWSFNL